jgi:hypothetical protein
MSTPLTTLASNKAAAQNQIPQLVLEIQGYPYVISLGPVTKYIHIGDEGLVIGDDWTIGGLNQLLNNLDLINLKASSKTIAQQVVPDKGGSPSVPSFSLNLIDVDLAMSQLISPSVILPDILGVRADLYLGYQGTAYPQDFVRVIAGIIDRTESGAGITLNVAHPELKKKTDLFVKQTTKTTSASRYRSKDIQGLTYITRRDVVTSVTVTYTSGGSAGNETVTVLGTNITVQLQVGVSTANNIRDAIEGNIDALTLVTVDVIKNLGSTLQTTQASTTLDTDTTINVESTIGFLLPVPSAGFLTYIRIDDEVIQYTGLTSTSFTGCTRAALVDADSRAEGAHHDTDTSVDSFYRIQGDAMTMALRLLMSEGGNPFVTGVDIKHIGNVEETTTPNAVYFDGIDVITKYGITIGAIVSIVGDPNASNNVVNAIVSDVLTTQYGSYIILGAESLIESLSTPATCSFTSQYNVYPEGAGLGLSGEEVDVPQFEMLLERYASSILTYDFYLKDTIAADEFINTKVIFSSGGYSIPRLGKISVSKNVPPLGTSDLVRLTPDNTQNPQNNKITRSISKYFYNTVVYKFNEAVVDERMLSGEVDIDTVSRNRIKIGVRALTIDCGGIRPTVDNLEVINVLKDQFRNKFRFGAEVIEVSTFYGETFNADVGDVVVFGEGLNLVDTKSGTRNFIPRLWDVLNKSMTVETGDVKLTLMDSAYSLADARFGIISPSSLVGAGSTISQVKIKNSYDIVAPRTEDQKWHALKGIKLIIHSEDWTTSGETYFQGISTSDKFSMNVDPALAFVPTEDMVVDIAPYPDNSNVEDDALAKGIYVFTNPTVNVVSGVSTTIFNVDISEVPLFLVGHPLIIHNEDYTILSPEVKVLSVVGTLVTVTASLGFVPASSQEIELIGYKDNGAPYRYF